MRLSICFGLVLVACGSWNAEAQQPQAHSPEVATAQATTEPVIDMDTVVVSGAQPGPGLWRVSRDGHMLYILGTQSPLPKRMIWLSRDVEQVIAASQEAIKPPRVKVDADIGIIRGALLIPSMLKARRNPDDQTLRQVLTPELYARWEVLKTRYLGRDKGVEKWRPIFAARELYEAALKRAGLAESGIVSPVVDKAIKQHGLKVTTPLLSFKVEQPRQALKEFAGTQLDDSACFRATLDRVENDLPLMAARANAWAVGDIPTLRALPYGDQNRTCAQVLTETEFARKRGIANVAAALQDQWLEAAENALRTNASTFATLPISELLRSDGPLAKLQAKGYQVEAPE